MNPLEQFLEKFKSFLTARGASKKTVIGAIKNITGIELSENEIEIKNGAVALYVRPLIKNEIFMRKSAILKELEQVGGISDIR